MAAVLIVAAALRLYELDFQSLWLNELDSWFISQHDDVGVILGRTAIEDLHPPGYQLMLWAWIQAVGDSEFALRLLSAVTGVLAVGSIGLLGRQLFDRATGLLSAAIVAVLWVPVYYSQEARSYGTLFLASILSTLMAVKMIQRHEATGEAGRGLQVAWMFTALLTAYLHYFGLLVVAFHLLLMLIRIGWKRVTIGMAAIFGLLYLPWVPSMLQDRGADHWLTTPSLRSWGGFYSWAFNRSPPLALVALPLQLLALFDARRELNRRANPWRAAARDPVTVLLLWVAVPTTIAFVASFFFRPLWLDRSLIVAVAPLYVLLARGVVLLPTKLLAQTAAAVLVGVFLIDLLVAKQYYTTPTKDGYRAAVGYVIENQTGIDTPIVGVRHEYYYDYYLDRLSGDERRVTLTVLDGSDADELKELALKSPSQEFWLIDGPFFRPEQDLEEILDRDFQVEDSAEFTGARAILYRLSEP